MTIEASDLYRFFHVGDDETLALRGVSLAVDAGDVVAITGPSGSGKSTLLACLACRAGLDEPDGGMVRVLGATLSRRSEQERARIRARSIAMLFQSLNLIQHLTVMGNVLLAQSLAGTRDATRAAQLVDFVGLAARAEAYPSTLSGGEAARAGLAVALANRAVTRTPNASCQGRGGDPNWRCGGSEPPTSTAQASGPCSGTRSR